MASLMQAKTKYGDFTTTLNNMIKGNIEPNEFQLTKIKKEAIKIAHDEPVEAYLLLGMVACVENDEENMHKHHKNAISLRSDFDTNGLYAISLLNSDLFSDAYDRAHVAYGLCGEDVYDLILILDVLISCCYYLDYEEELDSHLKSWKKVKNEDHPMPFSEDNSDNLEKMFECLDARIASCPDEIEKIDPEMVALAESLVEGVELYED